MTKDIYEKIIASLAGLCVLALFIWLGYNSSCEACDTDSAVDMCSINMDDADDFEGEFLQPSIPQVAPSKPAKKDLERHLVSYNGRYFSYSRKFADRNESHLNAAQSIGLSHGPENRAEAAKMRKQLREVKTCTYYVVEDLTHSLPYLVPTAANRLDSIGREFNDILMRNGLPHYRFRVTSVLRSQEDIRRLKRCNSNSISNSPHNYGTTFDLGYCHYDKVTQTTDSMTDDNLKLVLAQVLLNQQRAGHIYVKYEYKQGCFHVTARN